MDLLILTQGVSFSPIQLFLEADWVVKAVIIGLALASIWAWMIIVSFMLKISRINRDSDRFERDFWKSSDIDGFFGSHGQERVARRPRFCRRRRRMAALDQWQEHRSSRHARTAGNGNGRQYR